MSRRSGASPTDTRAISARATRARFWMLLPPISLFFAAFIAFAPSLDAAFVFDDLNQIVRNESIRNPGDPLGLLNATKRPVTNLTFAANYAWGELDPVGYHAFNIVLHAIASYLLYTLVRATRRRIDPDRVSRPVDTLALAVALLWAVHPLQTQVVAYTIQRSEALAAIFMLGSLLALHAGADDHKHTRWWYVGSVLCAFLAVGSKETAVVLPVIAALYDRAFLAGSFAGVWRERKWTHLGILMSWAVLLATGMGVGVFNPNNSTAAVGFGYKGVSPVEYFMTQPGVILHYLRLVFIPVGQCADYAWPPVESVARAIPSLTVLAAAGVLTLRGIVKNQWWGFVAGAFFILLAPTSSVIPIKDIAFEHRMYMALACVLLLVISAVNALFARVWGLGTASSRKAAAAALLIAASALVATTFTRSRVFTSDEALWRDVIRKGGNIARAQNNLAIILNKSGRLDEAEEAYRAAVDADPDNAHTIAGYAALLHQRGRTARAIEQYERALGINPNLNDARINLAAALASQDRLDEAARLYAEALERAPSDDGARLALGELYFHQEQYQAAFETLSPLRDRIPPNAPALRTIGNVHVRLGQWAEAERAYLDAIRVDASDAITWYNLGITHVRQGNDRAAHEAFANALRNDPSLDAARREIENIRNRAAGAP